MFISVNITSLEKYQQDINNKKKSYNVWKQFNVLISDGVKFEFLF